jgi:hypothetical protein
MRALVLGVLFALLGLVLMGAAVLGVVVVHHLEPGDSTPLAMYVVPPIVLGTWTGLTTRHSTTRFRVALAAWAVVVLLFLAPTLFRGLSYDADLLWLLPGFGGALVLAVLVRSAGVRWGGDGPRRTA